MAGLIDTHVHVWNFEKATYSWLEGDTSILNRHYNIEELEAGRLQAGVTAGVLVQAANNGEDTEWMLAVAERTSWIKGVIGWLPLLNPQETARLLAERYSNHSHFKGVRHLIHNEADPRWLLRESVLESLQIVASYGLTYDLVGVTPAHIQTALVLARKVPGLKVVFDHLNQPPIASRQRFGVWGELMEEAAGYPGFYVKISGLGTASRQGAGWSTADVEPYIRFVLERFGPDRSMCGGDWPVSLLAGSYTQTWQVYKEIINRLLGSEDASKVFYQNAQKFYSLGT